MDVTLVAFVVTLLASFSLAFLMARTSSKKKTWLEEIESKRHSLDR